MKKKSVVNVAVTEYVVYKVRSLRISIKLLTYNCTNNTIASFVFQPLTCKDPTIPHKGLTCLSICQCLDQETTYPVLV